MNMKRYMLKTRYNAEKANKASNFELLNKNYCLKKQTVLVGDSITELFNHTELFAQYTEQTGIKVYNRGISGDTSIRLLERLEKNVLNIKPRNMVLLIGINDITAGADADYIAGNVEKIITQARKRCKDINIILEAVYPVNRKIRHFKMSAPVTISELNKKLSALAEKEKISFLDFTQELSDENGVIKDKYTYDGLHVNAPAYEIISKAIIPLLK